MSTEERPNRRSRQRQAARRHRQSWMERFAHRPHWRAGKRDRYSVRDSLDQASRAISARPARSLLSIAATVLGIAALVMTVGLSSTGQDQVGRAFDLSFTQYLTIGAAKDPLDPGRTLTPLPWDADERISRLGGVHSAGALATMDDTTAVITASPVYDPTSPPTGQPRLAAITPGTLPALGASLATGTRLDAFHEQRRERVAILGANAAAQLNITSVQGQPTVFIDQAPYAVLAIASHFARHAELLDAVMIPLATAHTELALHTAGELQVAITSGAGTQVAAQAPTALSPQARANFEIRVPPSSNELHDELLSQLGSFFALLGAIALLLGALAIAIVTTLSVIERRGEIGLRRALGATSGQIAGQLLTETAILGLLGGLLGASLGTIGLIAMCAANGWPPVLDPWTPLLAAFLGTLVGCAAGFIPALRAIRIEPAVALQEGT